MNKPLSDAELQHRMMAHTADVVNTITALFSAPPRRMGESDDQHTARTDRALQDELFNLLERVEACINRVNAGSSVMEISLGSFQDWRHDNCVASREYWNGKISEARG